MRVLNNSSRNKKVICSFNRSDHNPTSSINYGGCNDSSKIPDIQDVAEAKP